MKPTLRYSLWVLAAHSLMVGGTANAEPLAEQLETLVSEGSANLDLRYRYEAVDEDNARKNAKASTLRSRISLQTATVAGFSGMLEMDNVSTIGSDDYDSLMSDDSHFGEYSVVADPVGTEVNQAWLRYSHTPDSSATVGRQRIVQGDQRFVGGVAWRQNEQTYDAFRVALKPANISLDYSYLWRVNRIFEGSGESVNATEFDSESHLLRASGEVAGGTLSAYVYALDFEEGAALSSITSGLNYAGNYEQFSYKAKIATQSDYGENPQSYDAMYLLLEGKVKFAPLTLIAGYELLGSDDGNVAFSTPLATLHKFQGWADMFLATPVDGVEDRYVGISGSVDKLTLAAYWHDFKADEGGASYGDELDLVAGYPISKQLSAQLKYARYSADSFKVDTEKLWFTLQLKL